MKQSKVLTLDIETSLMLVYTFNLGKQVVRSDQIYEDWAMLSWCAKWLGAKPLYDDCKNDKDDKRILKKLWALLNEADIVVTHNGRKFDSRRINARFMVHGMPPPAPYKHFDTYQLIKIVADHTSNSLAYITKKLKIKHEKSDHKQFKGRALWEECRKGNKQAWNEMKKYNIQDVLGTEDLYLKLRAWAPQSFPKTYMMTDENHECGTCGYEGSMREGKPRKTKKYSYRQNSCPKCGAWQSAGRIK